MAQQPLASRKDVAAYLDADLIECLECGRRFRFLGRHILVSHGITAANYRTTWGLPAGTPLAGIAYREKRRLIMHQSIATGRLTHDHLSAASDAARCTGRGERAEWERAEQSKRTKRLRPGDHHALPPGAVLASGKNADRVREYQRAYRALKSGDPGPMRDYQIAHGQ